MQPQRKPSSTPQKNAKEHLQPEDFVTSELEAVDLGAKIVMRTLVLYTVTTTILLVFIGLLVCLLAFPELRKDVVSIFERYVLGWSQSL